MPHKRAFPQQKPDPALHRTDGHITPVVHLDTAFTVESAGGFFG